MALLQKDGQDIKSTIENHLIQKDNVLNDIKMDFYNGIFINRNNRLYFEPYNNLNLKGLRILRSGLLLGEYKYDKFEMSHALVCALKSNEYSSILNYKADDPQIIKYLKCETLDVKDKYVNGNVLICVDNYPLGFGVANKGILKNKYPQNYRYK